MWKLDSMTLQVAFGINILRELTGPPSIFHILFPVQLIHSLQTSQSEKSLPWNLFYFVLNKIVLFLRLGKVKTKSRVYRVVNTCSVHISIHIYTHTHIYTYMHTPMNYICIYVYIVYIYTWIIYVYMYVYVYIYMYTPLCTHAGDFK